MVKIRFYSSLKQFGSQFELDATTPAECLRALLSQIPKLRAYLQQGWFKIRIGKDYIDNRYVEQGLHYRLKAGQTLHITPTIKGAKKGGVFQAIAGAVMVAIGFATSWTGAGLYIGAAGVSLLLGGVAQMLTKTPSVNTTTDSEKTSSTAFSNVQNRVAQGKPIPLAYGRIRCGSMIISQGVETYTVDDTKTAQTKVGFSKG